MASLQKSHGKWFCVFSHNGNKKEWVPLHIPDSIPKIEARRICDKLEHERALGLFDMTKPKDMAFNEFAEIYWKRRLPTITKNTADADFYRLRNLKKHFHSRPLAEITLDDLEELKSELGERGLHSKSVNEYLIMTGHIFNKAVEWGYLAQRKWIKLPKLTYRDKKERYCLTIEEIERFCEEASKAQQSPRFHLFCMLLIYTAMRRAEVLFLMWNDIDFKNGLIHVRNKPQVGFTTKSAKSRVIPILPPLREFLEKDFAKTLPDPEDWLFPEQVKVKHSGHCFRRAWEEAVKRAGLQGRDITPHLFRHSLASHLVMQGVGLKTVQEILGHRDIMTTANTYSHLLNDSKKEAMEKLPYGNYGHAQKPKL